MSLVTYRFGSRERADFIATLRATGNASAAARAAGISSTTAYAHRAADEVFRGEWDDALLTFHEEFEGAAAARAMYGVRKALLHKGEFVRWPADHPEAGQIAYEVVYSDSLVLPLLKAHRPERHRDRTETRLSGGLQTTDMDDATLLARAQQIVEDAKLRGEGEQPNGVRDIEFRELRPEDLL